MGNNSKEMQASGLVLIFLGGISLISPIVLNTISSITGIKIESLIIASIGGIAIGITFFVFGISSRKNTS